MDETKRYPTVQEASVLVTDLLHARGWTYEPDGRPGVWVDPADGRAYVATYWPVDGDCTDGCIRSARLLQKRLPGEVYDGFVFQNLIDF